MFFRATQIDIVEFSNKIIGLNEKTMTLYLLKTKEKIKKTIFDIFLYRVYLTFKIKYNIRIKKREEKKKQVIEERKKK